MRLGEKAADVAGRLNGIEIARSGTAKAGAAHTFGPTSTTAFRSQDHVRRHRRQVLGLSRRPSCQRRAPNINTPAGVKTTAAPPRSRPGGQISGWPPHTGRAAASNPCVLQRADARQVDRSGPSQPPDVSVPGAGEPPKARGQRVRKAARRPPPAPERQQRRIRMLQPARRKFARNKRPPPVAAAAPMSRWRFRPKATGAALTRPRRAARSRAASARRPDLIRIFRTPLPRSPLKSAWAIARHPEYYVAEISPARCS